jgi:long-chain fatty acid transport protein
MKKHFLAASLVLSAFSSFGAAYQLNLQGLRQMAMGGTGAAWPWDASTIYYNPGGLARLHGIQVYASALAIMPSTAFANQSTSGNQSTATTSIGQTFVPFSVYVGGPIQQDSKFAVGLGIYTPAGMGLKWDDNWLGKYIVQDIQLKAVCFQPTISYRVSDLLSVGGGFIYTTGTFDMKQALPVHGPLGPNYDDGQAKLHGTANGVGFNLGVHLRVREYLQVGVTYRSQINMSVGTGTADFTVPASLRSTFPNTNFDTQLPLPQVATIGIGVRPVEALTIQFDLNYTGWNSYDSLRINFQDNTSGLKDVKAPRQYRNTLTPRIGANYKISKIVSVMLGGAYDPTPVRNGFVSPDLPDGNRAVITCGAAIKPLRGFTILAAFESTSTSVHDESYNYGGFSGAYKTQAFTTGLGIYYNF